MDVPVQQIASSNSSTQSQTFVKSDDFRKFIEMEVLRILKDLVEHDQIDQEGVQNIAQMTLAAIKPGMTLEELYLSAVKLDDRFPLLAPLIIKIMREYEEKYEKKALLQVSELIKAGKYDDAQDMVKKVLLFKVFN